MSILYSMVAVCDGCGHIIDSAEALRPGQLDYTRWKWQRNWKARQVLRVQQYKAPEKLYCHTCADSPPPAKQACERHHREAAK